MEIKEEGEWDHLLLLTRSSAHKSVPIFQESRILSVFDGLVWFKKQIEFP